MIFSHTKLSHHIVNDISLTKIIISVMANTLETSVTLCFITLFLDAQLVQCKLWFALFLSTFHTERLVHDFHYY